MGERHEYTHVGGGRWRCSICDEPIRNVDCTYNRGFDYPTERGEAGQVMVIRDGRPVWEFPPLQPSPWAVTHSNYP